jgi:hypothetical protein
MDHLWLERSFLLVTLLCSLTLGGSGDTKTMKKVSSLFCYNNRALIFGANNSSQAAKSQWQSLQLLEYVWGYLRFTLIQDFSSFSPPWKLQYYF